MEVIEGVVERDYPLIQNCLYVGRGINLRQNRRKEVHIYLKERNTHLLGLGRTRWGKTEFIARCSADDVEFGNSLFCIDPKGSYDWLEKIAYVAYKRNRLKELMIFNLLYPELSVRLNPLAGLRPEKIGEYFYRLAPESEDAFFPQVAQNIGETVAFALYALGKEEINIWDVYKNSSVRDFDRLYRELQNYAPKTDRERKLYKEYYHDAVEKVRKIKEKDAGFWSKVNTSFEVSVSRLATGLIGKLMGKVYGNPLQEKLLRGEPILFFAYLGVLDIGEMTGAMVARLLSSVTHHVYGVYYTKNQVMIPPIAEYWDEASNVFYDGAQDKFNKAGGVNCYIHAFTQSLADPKKAIGTDLTKILQDNANYILFSVIDAETQKYFEQAFGYVKGYDIIWKKEDFDLVQVEKPLVPADAFARLWKGAFHAFIEARYYRGYSPLLKTPEVWLYPLPYPDKRIIEKKWGIDHKKAPPEIVAQAREIANDFELFVRENEKYRFFSGIVIDLTELEYYEEFVKKTVVKGTSLKQSESKKEAPETPPLRAERDKSKEESQEELPESSGDLISDFFDSLGESEERSQEEGKTDETSAYPELKRMIEEFGLNQLYKNKELVVFKKGERVYFSILRAKKRAGEEIDGFNQYSVRYFRKAGKVKIPVLSIFIGVPAEKLGLSSAPDCDLVEEIRERTT